MAFVELFALAGIAVAQPTFDLLGKNANELVVNARTRPQILALVVLVLVVPPALAWLAEVAVGLVAPRLRPYAHAAIAALILATFAVELLKRQTEWGATALVVAGAAAGLLGGYLLLRYRVPRLFLHYLAFAPVVFAIMFVFFSPVTTVLFPKEARAADIEIGNPARVVMVVMDEFPLQSLLDGNGEIDAELFPNFARLANTSNWFRNHTTVSPTTPTAVPAILSGELPDDADALPIASEHPDTLFTLLGGQYAMNVHEPMTQLCPSDICPIPAARRSGGTGLRGFVSDTVQLWRAFASPNRRTAEQAGAVFDLRKIGTAQRAGGPFIRSLRPADEPKLDYLHLALPHAGWHYLGTGQDNYATFETGQEHNAGGHAIWPDDWRALVGRQRHLLQLQYADRVLGGIIDKLQRIGAWDDSLVVVTADHGVAFSATDLVRGVSAQNYAEIMWTPLFVKAPNQTARQLADDPVLSLDVLPTLADLLEIEVPWKLDGRSAFGAPRTDQRLPILPWAPNSLVRDAGAKYATVDGPSGFAAVLGARAAPAGSDPQLRLYRLGPFGALIGTSAAPLLENGSAVGAATVHDTAKFDVVDPTARGVPWSWISGTVADVAPGTSVAITVNGTIAGISELTREGDGTTSFWSSLAPQLFRAGPNEIGVYRVDGSPSAPRLTEVRLTE